MTIIEDLRESWEAAVDMLERQLGLMERGRMNMTFSQADREAMMARLRDGIAVYKDLLARVHSGDDAGRV